MAKNRHFIVKSAIIFTSFLDSTLVDPTGKMIKILV